MIRAVNTIALLPPDQRDEALQRAYQRVFCTTEGALVLASILADLGHTKAALTPQEVALKNYGDHLLHERIGVPVGLTLTVAALNSIPGGNQ